MLQSHPTGRLPRGERLRAGDADKITPGCCRTSSYSGRGVVRSPSARPGVSHAAGKAIVSGVTLPRHLCKREIVFPARPSYFPADEKTVSSTVFGNRFSDSPACLRATGMHVPTFHPVRLIISAIVCRFWHYVNFDSQSSYMIPIAMSRMSTSRQSLSILTVHCSPTNTKDIVQAYKLRLKFCFYK